LSNKKFYWNFMKIIACCLLILTLFCVQRLGYLYDFERSCNVLTV